MSVYSYTRVSTGRAATEGQSLGAQERQVEGYAMMLGLTITETVVEPGVSGSVPLADRPAGRALLARLRPGDVVISNKLDRMFRSASDALGVLADLKTRGVQLHLIDLGGDVTGNGISKLVFTILSAVAENERERIRERVSDMKFDQKQRGRYLGGATPYGKAVGEDGQLVDDAEQQAVIARMRALRAAGRSLRTIKAETAVSLSIETINKLVS